MKTAAVIVAATALGFALPVGAQSGGGTSAQATEARLAEIVTQRETIIASNLAMTPDERAAFWPIYRKYRAERDEVDNRATKLTADFEKYLGDITEERAHTFSAGMLDLLRADLAVKTKYLRSFEKALTQRKAAKFYQIENKLDATLNYYRAERVPLMR